MTEPRPKDPTYEPNEQYRRDVEKLLARMLEVPRSETGERFTAPEGVHHVQWKVEDDLYWMVCGNTGVPEQDDVVSITRLSDEVDATYHLRTYRYSRITGLMNVVDEELSEEDMAMRYRLGEVDPRYKAVDEIIELGLFSASFKEYRDFLEDLTNFQASAWS